ncbi:hypothetical protein C8R44DRAFT_892614 [Mycena epipterygia]|nr:hypothetical protein C8R44DRAFT_892614 [Mycena epipterygia]
MTNTNEAQHHWTNTLTEIKLTPSRRLKGDRRVVDQNVAREIGMSLEGGILSSPKNEVSHRMARSFQRQSNAARKSRASRQAANISKELQLQIDAEAEKRRVSNEFKGATQRREGPNARPRNPVGRRYLYSAPFHPVERRLRREHSNLVAVGRTQLPKTAGFGSFFCVL